MDNRHPSFAGVIGLGINPKLKDRLDATDLLIVLGSQLGEIVSGGYTYFTFPKPKQTMIHICAGIDELGKVYQADLGINSGMAEFCAAARAMWRWSTHYGHTKQRPRTRITSRSLPRPPCRET